MIGGTRKAAGGGRAEGLDVTASDREYPAPRAAGDPRVGDPSWVIGREQGTPVRVSAGIGAPYSRRDAP
ncbi:hypothetical protein Prum_080510 [Phytohabitans rumicis]|uniref:Uncharacterized protein n=1 Tax=Phytohabitans rumicis TaxID=1076125 RepID=A0A6V8LID4_9ACTN|nr:hypothetical protein Prum_080510 [Phytohabitans rumicis]